MFIQVTSGNLLARPLLLVPPASSTMWFWFPQEPLSRVQALLGPKSPCPLHLEAQTPES